MTAANYPGPETIRRRVLDNGIVVLVYENFTVDMVVIDGFVRAGANAEPRAKAGLADFTASMLLRGTAKRSFGEIYDAIESVGVSVEFGGGRHISEFSGSGLSEDFDLMLELLRESLSTPAFPQEQVDRLRGQVLTGLQIRATDTRQMSSLRFRESLYGPGHPYGASVRGYADTIMELTRDDLVAFHSEYYGPAAAQITVVGALKADDVFRRVDAVFGDWRNADQKSAPAAPPASRPAGLQRVYTVIPEKTQADIVLGLPGPLRSAPDYLHVSVANTILGVFGMMGRLGKTVREEQGLAYYVSSQVQGGLGPAPWSVATGVAPDKVEQAIASIRHEIRRIQNEPVPLDELRDSQAYRTGSLPMSLETNDGLASVIGDMDLYNLGMDYLQTYADVLGAITPADIQAAAQKYFSADDIVVSIAGPPEVEQLHE